VTRIKINPPYKHLTQRKDFCGPACVQMVLLRRGIQVDQEATACEIGTRIDERDKNLYHLPLETLPAGDHRVGTWLGDFAKEKAQGFFKKHGLAVEVRRIGEIENPGAFIAENIDDDNDMILNFWWKPINDQEWGHFVLLSGFDPETGMVTLCDPSYMQKSFWDIRLDKIVEAMDKKWTTTERGFAVVKKA